LTRRLTDEAVEYAQGLTNGIPSFLWLHYFDPHDPYLPPSEFLDSLGDEKISSVEADRQLYGAEVRFVDDEIGRFLDVLKQQGIYDESIIILTSDHGEGFLEHGELKHGSDLYQEQIAVPLMIRMPGGYPRKTVADYVPTNALLPTVLDLVDLHEQPQPGWAPSLADLIQSEDTKYRHPIVSGANFKREPQWSIVLDEMKYIYREETGREEVYDLAMDPSEQRPLIELPEPFISEAREALAHHLEFAAGTLKEEGITGNGPVDQEMVDRMKSLGYIQ
jgi:arylsulfatase A-like enzyme